MEEKKLDFVPDPYTKATFELLSRVFDQVGSQGIAFPIPNGSNVTYIATSNIENVVIGESKDKIKSKECFEHLVQQPQMVQDALECMPQPLLKLNDFSHYISSDIEAALVVAFLREELEGKEPEEVTTVIYCAAESGLLKGIPTYRAVMHAFGQIVTKQLYISCMAAGFDDEEVAPYMERFRKKRAELLKSDEAPLQPLPWQRLFGGGFDERNETDKSAVIHCAKMIWRRLQQFVADGDEQRFLAILGLDKTIPAAPIVFNEMFNDTCIHAFVKMVLFNGERVCDWIGIARLFTKKRGVVQNLQHQTPSEGDKALISALMADLILPTPSI